MDTTLSDKTFVVTGATSGIGLEVARQLIDLGAAVIGVGRSPERCRAAESALRAGRPTAQATFVAADLSLQSEVRRAAAEARRVLDGDGRTGLDGLVNNAGVFTFWLALTAEGFETQWAVNHLASFLLTNALLPLLQAALAARVVTVSSGSHTGARLNWDDLQLLRRYNGLRAYERTKLANVMFTAELNRRLGPGSSVRAFAADPGLVKTDIGLKGTPALVRWVWAARRSGGISAAESAAGIVALLAGPGLEDTGQVYWKHGRPRSPSRRALDPQEAERLWEVSARMCGIM
jgi:NAD(P)-dependent dehydrogenase (short-subunit alcohol dehydrogenase family)